LERKFYFFAVHLRSAYGEERLSAPNNQISRGIKQIFCATDIYKTNGLGVIVVLCGEEIFLGFFISKKITNNQYKILPLGDILVKNVVNTQVNLGKIKTKVKNPQSFNQIYLETKRKKINLLDWTKKDFNIQSPYDQ